MAVYLDNNATTALHEQVKEAMLPYLGSICGNPSSVHRFGRLQRDAIELARDQVAKLAGARTEQVIFTSGGTEANNMLLRGLGTVARKQADTTGIKRIAVSAIEHMSLLEPAAAYYDYVDYIRADANGLISEAALLEVLKPDTGLVSVMLANNETGVIQNLEPLVESCHQRGIFFHSDATQAAGKIKLNFAQSGLHAMTLSAHKLYGPAGAGALIVDKALPLKAVQLGGSQEKGLRAGTENVAAIVGFGKAAEIALAQLAHRQAHTRKMRDALEAALLTMSGVTVFGREADRLPNTVQFAVDGFEGETLLMQLDRKAIAVSSGSACTSGKAGPSHVLAAMNIPAQLARGAVRVSFGDNNTDSDVNVLIKALQDIVQASADSSVMMAASI